VDAWLFLRIYAAFHPSPFGPILAVWTRLGDYRGALAISLLGMGEALWRRGWAWRGKKRSDGRGEGKDLPFALMWAGIPLAGLITQGLKMVFDRPRPWEVFPALVGEIPLKGSDSFPSGHATFAFALAKALSLRWPRWKAVWLTLALGVALSRVALGLHWPTDVVVGAGIGWLVVKQIAWFETWLERRMRLKWLMRGVL